MTSLIFLSVTSTTQRSSCVTLKKCWRMSSCLCSRSQSTPAATQSCTSSFSMCEVFTVESWINIFHIEPDFTGFHISCVALCHTGGGFRQCGWRVKTRATHLQPGQSAASQLDGGGQPALFLLPLLHVCKHDSAESPAQVRVYTSVQVATIICFLWMQSLPYYMFYLFTRNTSSTLIFQDH